MYYYVGTKDSWKIALMDCWQNRYAFYEVYLNYIYSLFSLHLEETLFIMRVRRKAKNQIDINSWMKYSGRKVH